MAVELNHAGLAPRILRHLVITRGLPSWIGESMKTKTRFLNALRALGGSAGNLRLQAELGLTTDVYQQIRDEIVEEGLVVRGRGRGGSVSLVGTTNVELPLELAPLAQKAGSKRRNTSATRTSNDIYLYNFSPATELREFSFTIQHGSRGAHITSPSFMLLRGDGDIIRLAKIRRTRKVATYGTALDLYDVRQVQPGADPLTRWANAAHLELPLIAGEVADLSRAFRTIRGDLLRLNQDLTEDYFLFHAFAPDSDIPVQFGDAIATGFRFFHRTAPLSGYYKGLQEQEIFDLDIQSFVEGAVRYDPFGRCEYIHGDRRLLIHKVDRKKLERCLGIDLVYNYIDEKRCVFVQYKCQGTDGEPYYFSSDKQLARQVERMGKIPGHDECPNLSRHLSEMRLCGCSAFVKLCRREVHMHHNIPRGAYFPLCTWTRLMKEREGVHVGVRPHLTNEAFTECVRGGNIGTSPHQTHHLHHWLDESGEDERVRLIFDEEHL